MEKKKVFFWNRILLGLVMLIPGILKLVATLSGDNFVSGILSGIVLFAWAPLFWAWILILVDIGVGSAILLNWNVKNASWLAIIILLVAAFTVNLSNPSGILTHVALASNYLIWIAKK